MVNALTDYALTLYYPTAAAPTSTIQIRAPEMGDPETVDLREVIEESGGGKPIVFKRGPTIYRLAFEFAHIYRVERNLLETFFRDTVEGAVSTFELRRPKYHSLDANEVPLGAFLYSGCQFEHGVLEFREIARRGYYATSVRIRATGRSDSA